MLLVHREADVWGIAELLTLKRARVVLLLRIGLHFTAQAGMSGESMQVFRRAQSIALTIEEANERASALHEIAQALSEAGQDTAALRVLILAEQIALSIELADHRAFL